MTLYRKLKDEMENHRNFWNYYGVDFDDVFQDEGVARDFIYNYFKGGSKLYALDSWANSMNEYIQMRNVHTVNVFFIGAFLQRMIDENIAIKSEVSSYYPFSYVWYLLCLAHDFGYVYENYSNVYLELPTKRRDHCWEDKQMRGPKFLARKRWYQEHGIDITYLHPSFGERSNIACYNRSKTHNFSGVIEYNNGTIVNKPRYSRATKDNYFYYRLLEMQKLDHGIVGADEFFSRLVVNYVKEYRMTVQGDFFRGSVYDFHNAKGLHFCSEQIKIFAYIADCIASHNMYKAKDNEICKAKYVNYSLNCLLPDKFRLISYKDNPLLFILCVADTIEPSKRFANYDNKDILDLISIDYNVNTNLLCVEIDEELHNSDAGNRYIADIEGLETWCDIKVNIALKRFKNRRT